MPLILFLLIPAGLAALKFIVSASAFLTLIGYVVEFAGKLINSGIQYQNAILNTANIPVIQIIWQILRDFVNIFFILILLVIAFATIFNVSKYKAKDLLPQLIIAALLINFSLVITSEITKLFWVPASVFLAPLGSDVDGRIVDALRIQKFFDPAFVKVLISAGQSAVAGNFFGWGGTSVPDAMGATAVQIALRTVILVINAFILSWIALIIWARIIVIMGLMIVSPIAWLGYALPAIKDKTWGAWWQKLFTWGAIPIPLFGLIYFTIYFKNALTQQISGAIPASILQEKLAGFGFNADLVFVWLLTMALFLGGLMYIKTLTGGLYNWTMAGFKGTWKGIRKGVGWAVETPYEALGYKGAVGKLQKEFKEGGYPIFGKRMFGTAQKEAREAGQEERFRKLLGLGPIPVIQRNLLSGAEKETKNIDDEFKQAGSTAEETAIIDKLRTKIASGAKDPETLAAINALAKKGQLDVALFNQAVENFKDMPLVLTKIFSEWKEGKFGGIKADELIPRLKDMRTPLEAKRIGYNFIASDDGKRVIQDRSFDPAAFKEMYEVLGGRNTKDGRNAKKFVGEINPFVVGDYNFHSRTTEFDDPADYPTDVADAILKQIKKTGSKDFTKYGKDLWNNSDFKAALADLLYDKATKDIGNARKYAEEVRKWLIRESKDEDELRIFNDAATTAGI